MEYRISGEYGETTIKISESEAIVTAKINGKEYSLKTNDIEHAVRTFVNFAGRVGAEVGTPEVVEVEITKGRKVIVHLGYLIKVGEHQVHVYLNSILPNGVLERIYLPANGVVRRFHIYLT